MEKIRGKTLKEWKEYSDKDKYNIPIRTTKYIIVLEEQIEQLTYDNMYWKLYNSYPITGSVVPSLINIEAAYNGTKWFKIK